MNQVIKATTKKKANETIPVRGWPHRGFNAPTAILRSSFLLNVLVLLSFNPGRTLHPDPRKLPTQLGILLCFAWMSDALGN
jgi:hypothetical protein